MDKELSENQIEALEAVKKNPNQPVEYYANMLGNTPEIYSAFARLIFQQYLKVDEMTGAVTTKGIS